jgi:hypothetical protein
MKAVRRLLILCCLALFLSACSPATSCGEAQGPDACQRILFIGNSYTYENDLPGVFAKLADAGGHRVEVGTAAQGGWSLSDHVNSPETLNKIESSKWNFVVLQEQSQIPAFERSRTQEMYPAARVLVHQIEEAGATPIFFITWAHREGWPENGLKNYEDMQFQIDRGYLGIAQELNAPVAPVGYAWLTVMRQYPQLRLWQDDGSHPGEQGTYLAACVFYAVIFRESPEGLTYLAGLPKETAQSLQTIAANTVLNNPGQWNLP